MGRISDSRESTRSYILTYSMPKKRQPFILIIALNSQRRGLPFLRPQCPPGGRRGQEKGVYVEDSEGDKDKERHIKPGIRILTDLHLLVSFNFIYFQIFSCCYCPEVERTQEICWEKVWRQTDRQTNKCL